MTDVDKAITEANAIKYARWLAARDGIELANTWKIEAVWGNHTRVKYVIFSSLLVEITIKIPHWDWQPKKEAA